MLYKRETYAPSAITNSYCYHFASAVACYRTGLQRERVASFHDRFRFTIESTRAAIQPSRALSNFVPCAPEIANRGLKIPHGLRFPSKDPGVSLEDFLHVKRKHCDSVSS